MSKPLGTDIDIAQHYSAEMDRVNQAISEMEELYTEVKTHYDVIKGTRGKGTLSFVQMQTGNLISIKNSLTGLIKERVNIKKAIADFILKKQANETSESKDTKVIQDLFKYINEQNNTADAKNVEYEDVDSDEGEEDEDVESALDAKLKHIRSAGLVETPSISDEGVTSQGLNLEALQQDKEQVQQEQEEVLIAVLVKDKKWSFIALNEQNKQVKNYKNLPNKKDFKIKLKKIDGKTVAIDQNERIYRVIRK